MAHLPDAFNSVLKFAFTPGWPSIKSAELSIYVCAQWQKRWHPTDPGV